MTGTPRIPFAPAMSKADPATPTIPYPLVPVAEPISVGAPPIRPVLVRSVRVMRPVRRVVDAAGYAVTSALPGVARPTFTLAWDAVGRDQLTTLTEWLRDTWRVGDDGSQFAAAIEVDPGVGSGGGAGGTIRARAVEMFTVREVQRGAWRVTVDAEEVFS